MDEEKARRVLAPRTRLSTEKRERFLEVLGQTGNRLTAAEAIGVDARSMDQRRKFDPLLDRQWEEALEQADRRLAGANGPLDCIGGAEPMVIRRGPGGRLRIVKAGPRRWSRTVEDRFFAMLAATGNIAGSARAAGFSESCIAQRRRKFHGFAQRMEEALEDAEILLEYRLAEASGWALPQADMKHSGMKPSASETGQAAPFDPDLAMRFLKWREQKRQGRGRPLGRRPKGPPERTFDEAVDSVLRKVKAIERFRNARKLEEGWSRDETGYMIPPGWVRATPES